MSVSDQPFSTACSDQIALHLQKCRSLFVQRDIRPAPPSATGDFLYCHESEERAWPFAYEHMSNYDPTVMQHYEIPADRFRKTKSYGGIRWADAEDSIRLFAQEVLPEFQSWQLREKAA